MFFFPGSRLERAEQISYALKVTATYDSKNQRSVEKALFSSKRKYHALEDFHSKCEEYFGLGFIASFVPGTRAYKARRRLSKLVDGRLAKVEGIVANIPNKDSVGGVRVFSRWDSAAYLKGEVGYWIRLGPIWRALNLSTEMHLNKDRHNFPVSWLKLILFLPLLYDIMMAFGASAINAQREGKNPPTDLSYFLSVLKALFHTVCNPVKLIAQAMTFAQLFFDKLISIGLAPGEDSSYFRNGLKWIVDIALFTVSIPVNLVMTITDVPYRILTNFIFSPLEFIATSFYRTCTKLCTQEQIPDVEEESPSLTPTYRMYSAVGTPREGSLPERRIRSDSVSSAESANSAESEPRVRSDSASSAASSLSSSSVESADNVDEAEATVSPVQRACTLSA